ncbi:MAG: class I SAM-dependent methyltransferase [Pseudomonadota bacterium]
MNDATFWDKVAPKYAKDPIKDMAAYEYTLGRTQSYLNADDRVLEIGCGTGSTALLLAPHVREIVGADVSPGMIDIAKAKVDADTANATFRVSSAQEAAKTKESFDVVLGFNIFHLVNRAEDIFADIYRLLPEGGYFISKTPCLDDPSFGLKRFLIKAILPPMRWVGKAPSLVRGFTQKELENAIQFAGFEIVESGNFPAISRYIVARKT